MRTLLLMRGSAGCGKSTYIEKNGLKPYTLCADDIRMLCSSPNMTADGSECISQANDKVVWDMLFKLLELRMQNGEFTVIDATNSKTSEMNRYKDLCDTYRYRMYCVDFTDVPIEVTKARNAAREPLKRVPEAVIDKMYARFATQKIPSGVTVLKPDELDRIWYRPLDLSSYPKIHVIGDIHGCYTALSTYLNGPLKDDELYIFCGDYLDRGLENVEVFNFLQSIYDHPNVWLLEGNHERWIWRWANDQFIPADNEFAKYTSHELEAAHIDKRATRKLCRKFAQCAYFNYNGNVYLVTHGGLSTIPANNLLTVATFQMIKGVGDYENGADVDDNFVATTAPNVYQIHGHRNLKSLPIHPNDRVYNLEGKIEFGGDLRAIEITPAGVETFEIPNPVFRVPDVPIQTDVATAPMDETITALRANKYIQEKAYGRISSFNFTRNAFWEKIWDHQTTKARGLFIDTEAKKVFARAYNKFFNINERPETRFENLERQLEFPVTAYVKENGFLGIVAYDPATDDLFTTSKTSPEGPFAGWFKDLLTAKHSSALDKIKAFCKDNDASMVFECVDMEHDPHVIEYPESRVFLLDVVYNSMEFKKMPYDELRRLAADFGLTAKEKAYTIENWADFCDWYQQVTAEDYEYNGRDIEGFVIEGANGFMVKLKLWYYSFWKAMRGVAHETLRKGYIDKTSMLTNATANLFYGWLKKMYLTEHPELLPKDICTLRKMFYEDQTKQRKREKQ